MKKGFTLVELSIVLVIIGLLIGGILVGQSLISSARISSIINDESQYEIAIRLFRTQFKGLPGDSSKAATAYGYTPTWTGIDNGALSWDEGPNTTTQTEDYVAWRQLSMGGFIQKKAETSDGIYSGTSASKQAVIGTNVPRSRTFKEAAWALTGYPNYSIGYSTAITSKSTLRLAGVKYSAINTRYPQPWNGPLTATEAMAVDSKVDDGKPGTGNVMHHAFTTALYPCVIGTIASTATYDISIQDSVCHSVFILSDY